MDMMDHYLKLIYFAFLEMQGELCHRGQLMAYYANVVMDEVHDDLSVFIL
jgi:hypothetical protein